MVPSYAMVDASNWWEDVNSSPLWQDRIFHVLAALYGAVAVVALVAIFPLSSHFLSVINILIRVSKYSST